MRNKSLQLCGLTLMLGIFGAFLRWLQASSVFDPVTGLAAPNAPLSYGVFVFLLIMAVSLFLLVRGLKGFYCPEKYPDVFARPNPFLQIVSYLASAFMALGGVLAVIRVITEPRGSGMTMSLLGLVAGILTVICAIALISLMSGAKVNKTGSGAAASIIIIIFMCLWLITAYKDCASDPVVWHFAIRILAAASALLAFYYFAGFSFGKPNPLCSIYFGLLGSALSICSLTDDVDISVHLVSVALALSLLALCFSTINNMRTSPPTPAEAPQEPSEK